MTLEIQKTFLSTEVQALIFLSNMKLYSPATYTLYAVSLTFLSTRALNLCQYGTYLCASLVDVIDQTFKNTPEVLFSALSHQLLWLCQPRPPILDSAVAEKVRR